MTETAVIFGCAGERLTTEEKAFFADVQPWGFIVFARNCVSREQLTALTAELRDVAGRETLPILVDQEGGRVMRLRPPEWPAFPPAETFAILHDSDPALAREALGLAMGLMANELLAVGLTVNCVPVMDVPVPGAHGVIGDRAYGSDLAVVQALGGLAGRALLAHGVLPVIKHIPGHGRARVDSHDSLPVVETARAALDALDFAAFEPVADLPLAMTAHVVYEAVDQSAPATLSAAVIGDVIRGQIGFDGLLMTDDLSMRALDGTFAERTRGSIAAGCDMILHCNGDMGEMVEVAAAAPVLDGAAARRAQAALSHLEPKSREAFDVEAAWDRLGVILEPNA